LSFISLSFFDSRGRFSFDLELELSPFD
jgi:hypothetical protein